MVGYGIYLNWTGLFMGLYMLGVIGIGFFWVVKIEYYLGARVWKLVLLLGLLLCLLSLFVNNFMFSALIGIFGGSVVWGATELPDQAERVRRGLFPANPRRQPEQQ
ncbi:MAG TPA: DUF4491 family protein [Anaerolineales bacterium]|nr:DUF4491 family protein [Anaerolineales bacterium]